MTNNCARQTKTDPCFNMPSNFAEMNSNDSNFNQQNHLDPHMESFSQSPSHQFQTEPQLQTHPHPQCQPQQRSPRGFVAPASTSNAAPELGGATPSPATPSSAGVGKGRREREKEKERTKLRERHRRAITSRMLSGLRHYGNFPLPARADMNDVLAALAREAGWIVEADGTTYRPSPPPRQLAALPVKSTEDPVSGSSFKVSLDSQPLVLRIDESLSPASFDSVVATERDSKNEKYANASPINSSECFEAHQLMRGVQSGEHANNFTGTPYVPVYVMLASGVIDSYCQLIDPVSIRQELKHLKSLNVDGVAIECWWGIVEGWHPQKYVWSGYRELFMIIQECQLKVQAVMAFHEFGRADTGDTLISLPHWVLEIGQDNPDIFFTDRQGQRNTECLSWGIDKERVLRGRTGVEVYFDFMRSFRTEFDDLFMEGRIACVEIGLGASGELKFPSYSERMGWRYPGIGEFQCYDKYLQQNLRKVAKLRGHSFWARGPDNAGQYNSKPLETGFFCERGDYDSYYGRFFLQWYAQTLLDHADNVLSLASLAFEETNIAVKIPAIYWWYKTASHATELTAGFYNSTNLDGYSPVFEILKKHSVTMRFAIPGSHLHGQENNEPFADPEGLSWQVLNAAWDHGLTVAGENAGPCDREEHIRMVETSKPRNDPDQRHFLFFTYRLPSPWDQRTYCFTELDRFIKSMHGMNYPIPLVPLDDGPSYKSWLSACSMS